ncbi:acyl-CoA dehydrogenase family protein [Nocardioides sp. AE5]|uniref:acyl-CoA dehydrogenase family protein n=1 Tax=Nocardioides sp. AE5 TaxID=2962573 RepID=UPI002880D5EE|nr:acyl-CoA dehydrogenase family protein [Nocardioides sp. AE5]MDT0203228.1 acyl-CoA dehydrogenase family protein [Nocardioides sp. AE5]
MDFGRLEDPEFVSFVSEVRAFLGAELDQHRLAGLIDRRDDFDPAFHRALGRRGWVMPEWPVAEGGAGLDRRHARALDLEFARAAAPRLNLSTTRTILPAIVEHAAPTTAARIATEAASGAACIAMGYSEPEGGSDIAAARTSARRDGTDWVIHGQKVFTTGAHHCRYIFLLTRTAPDAPKHAGLTMFLVPTEATGVHVSAMHTLDERTNVVTFDGVRVPDTMRIGSENDGWAVLLGPLNREHGLGATRHVVDAATRHSRRLAEALEAALAWAVTPADGTLPADEPEVRRVLAEVAVDLMAASSTWGHTGRIASAEAYLGRVGDLCELVGARTAATGHPWSEDPAGILEFHRRSSQVSTLYGGSVEVVRDVLAHELGLPRWNR